ncbi:trypsin-like [Bradysia coprophila]|uniref:trypsin-like n=1 Tax=Bradysia coprophila TaxID=38358 RepID=UPI00187D814C|nr:trypsin-like [Bradysia coprophila]
MRLQIILCAFIAYGVSGNVIIENDEQIVPLIVGGTPAAAGEFQGKISLQYTDGTHICGGTLIDPGHVLTSATCVTNQWGDVLHPSEYRLMGDDLTISVISGNANRQIRLATHVFVHPEFNLNRTEHDIAVIRVNETFTPSITFNPVPRGQDSPGVNTQCSVAGWGSTAQSAGNSFTLMRVNAVVISRAVCNSNTSYAGSVRGGMFCAGNIAGGQGTCQNDEGGGLICNNAVFGVVSRAQGCAVANFPTIYTDVAVYNTWIDSIINWNEGEHEIVPTPTSITSTTTPVPTTTIPTTTPYPDDAAIVAKSMYLFVACLTILLFR